jgi:oligopeptide transport system substrate-binding protein
MRKRILLVMVLLAALFFVTNCKKSETSSTISSEEQKTAEQVLTYSVKIDMPTLDQSMVNSVESVTMSNHLQEGLIRLQDGKVIPGIAKGWDISEDGLVYTFHLRDAKWSDGKNITANDFVYAIKRLVDPTTASPYSFIAEPIKNAMKVNAGILEVNEVGVVAPDKSTLEITLETPAPYFISMLNMPHFCPVRKDIVEEYGRSFAADAEKNVYSGPFVLDEWKHEDRLVLKKNQSYWNKDKVILEEVHVIVVSDPNTALSMFENGDLDFVDVPTNLVEQYKDTAKLYYSGADDFLKLNMDGSNLLKSKNLRLAVNFAIDREDYINITTNGLYDAGTRYVLPVVTGVNKKYGEEYPYEAFPLKVDVSTAKEYLQKAMAELGVTKASDISLELLTTDTDDSRIQAEVLQDQIQRNIGITVNIRQVPYKQRLQMESDHEFEMVFSGWAPDYDDPYTYLGLWITGGPYNQISYSNPSYDERLSFSSTCKDAKERMDALFDAEKILLEDAAIVPLQMRRIAYLINPKLKGLVKAYVGPRESYIYASMEK